MIAAASVKIAVESVGTACTSHDSSSTWFWIMSKPAVVVGSPAIQSTPIVPPRSGGGGRGWRSPRRPPCSAMVCWHVWHDRTYSATLTSWPTQKARRRTSEPVLARPKCPRNGPSWHSRRIFAQPPCRACPPHGLPSHV